MHTGKASGSSLAEVANFMQNVRMFRNVWLPLFLSSLLLLAGVDNADAQPPVLERLHIPNPVADVSAGQIALPVEISYTAPDNLLIVALWFTSSDGDFIPFSTNTLPGFNSSGNRLLRGSAKSGTHLFYVPVPPNRAAGPWKVSVGLLDSAGRWSFNGPATNHQIVQEGSPPQIPDGSPPLPAGSTTSLTLINSNPPDVTPPELTSLVMTPAVVDITGGQQNVTVTATASDLHGVSSLYLQLLAPGGSSVASLSMSGTHRVSGDAMLGTYESTMVIPPFLEPGQYTVGVKVLDTTQRSFSLGFPGNPTPAPAGVQTALQIQNTGPFDSSPPELLAISADRSVVDVTQSEQTVKFNVSAGGGLYGLTSVHAHLYRADGSKTLLQFSLYSDYSGPYESLISQQNIPFKIPRFLVPGRYRLRVFLQKAGGVSPTSYYGGPGDSAYPGGFSGDLEILNSGPVAPNPPVIQKLAVSPETHGRNDGVALLGFTVEATDNLGITGIRAELYQRPWLQGIEGTVLNLIQGTAQAGVWRGWMRVSPLAGEYYIRLTIGDTDQNQRVYQEIFDSSSYYSENSVPIPREWPSRFTITEADSGLPRDSYSVWRRGHSGLSGPLGTMPSDPDGDGIPNGLEYICGTDPLLPSQPGGPDPASRRAPRWTGDGLELESFSYQYTIGWGPSPVLKGWKSSTLAPGSWVPVTPQYDSGKQKYLLDPPAPNRRQQFLRLTVEP